MPNYVSKGGKWIPVETKTEAKVESKVEVKEVKEAVKDSATPKTAKAVSKKSSVSKPKVTKKTKW